MADLTEQERQAIQGVSTAWNRRPGVTDRADDVLLLVERVVEAAPRLLPILVAGLSEEARLSVLTPRGRAVMKLGEARIQYEDANKAYTDILKATPTWKPIPDYTEALGRKWNADDAYHAALAEARALSTEAGK